MFSKKTSVGILFGGKSAEHEISLKSAEALYKNIDRDAFDIKLIYIFKDGSWNLINEENFKKKQSSTERHHSFIPWENDSLDQLNIDIYFPILHGPNGEDGKVQGLFELAGKPFVGADSFSSAIAMDKVASKILLQKAGLKVGAFLYFTQNNYQDIKQQVEQNLGYPVFIKPCSLGSSVGISKVKDEPQLKEALELAFKYDKKIIIEDALDIREIEIAVMGNPQREIRVSRPGELKPFNEFYDYEDKYITNKTGFSIPANLDPTIEKEMMEIAEKGFRALFLNGMSRVDLFWDEKNYDIYLNEINTIPGFTEISMFPKLWDIEGISFTELITRLIEYGFEYYHDFKSKTG